MVFHNGNINSKTALTSFKHLDYDDYAEIIINTKFSKKVSNVDNVTTQDQKNIFTIEFLPNLMNVFQKNIHQKEGGDTILLNGLVIMLMTNDTSNDVTNNDQTYFFTYRFFSKPQELKRDYLNILFEKKDIYPSCNFDSMFLQTSIRIKIDFEAGDFFELGYKNSIGEWTKCFEIKDISKYITKRNSFLQLQQSTGSKYTLSTEITGIEIREKQTRLDIQKGLTVSHHLMEEIFDKLNSFTEIFSNDKDNLSSILDLQNGLINRASILEIYAKDLNSGTKKFQEYMLESLNKHKLISPESMPKLMKVKEKIENLERLQGKVFKRFVDIKGLVNTRKVFKKTYKNFKKINKRIAEIVREISSKEFKNFYKKTKKLMKSLEKLDFTSFFNQVEETIRNQKKIALSTANFGILVVVIFCLGIFIFAFFILKNINKSDKSHFV